MKIKRLQLSQTSRIVKQLMEIGETDAESVNEGLLELYSNGENLRFNTFHGWKDKGFKVKKGSQAYLVWGKPRKVPVPGVEKPTIEANKEEDEFKYWPICYLFSNKQVEKFKHN